MSRFQRGIYDSAVCHIITKGNNGIEVFKDADDFSCYERLIRKYQNKLGWLLHHYALMKTHVHMIIKIIVAAEFPKAMQGINQSYAHYYRKKYIYSGYLWQGRYKSLLIEDDAYLLECGRYVERNPVRAGIVRDPADYPWSSYRFYAFGTPNSVITPSPAYLDLASTPMARRKLYKEYVLADRPYDRILDKELKKLSKFY